MYFIKRILKALYKRALWLRDLRSWPDYAQSLQRWDNSADSQACVVICNGPSLDSIDVSALRDMDCFALNRAYLAFNDWGFIPKYFVCINDLVLTQFAEDIKEIKTNKFLNYRQKAIFDHTDADFLLLHPRDRVIRSVLEPMSCGATVTFVALQLALCMGYKKIGVIGLDHSFSGPGRPNETLTANATDENHFRSNYFSGEIKWEYPDLDRNERAYEMLREFADDTGVEIFDCTPGGKSEAFTKLPLNEFMERASGKERVA